MFRSLSFIIIFLQAASLLAVVINVPADQPNIQTGINSAINGDTVLVARGTYLENINFRGRNIMVASRYLLTGDLTDVDSTVIDGSAPTKPDTASCVLFISGEDSTAVLCGFTLTGGTGTKWPDEHGAGTYREGGGVLVAFCSPTIRGNRIIGNHAVGGTGLAGAGGGGIRAGDGNPHIINNVIALNSGADYGGGIVLNYSGATVRNNIIYGNSGGAAYGGGGLWLNRNGTMPKVIENNTIANNTSGSSGGGICFLTGTSATVRNVIIWGNSAPQMTTGHAATYSDIQGGWAGAGNIDSDPLFGDRNRFLLSASSPCVDAGDSAVGYNDPEDGAHPGQALLPARGALRSDIGAYGGPGSASLPRIPSIASFVTPAPGATKIGLLAPLVIAFSSPADTASLVFSFSDPAISLARQWNARHDTLMLTHAQSFANLGWYTLVLTGLRDTVGAVLGGLPDSATFRATDTVRPFIKSTAPADGASGIALNAKIYIRFSKPVNRSSFQYSFSDTSIHCTKVWYGGDTLMSLNHTKQFTPGSGYTTEVTAAQDMYGNDLTDGIGFNPFSFTAAAAGVEGAPSVPATVFGLERISPNPAGRGGPVDFQFTLPAAGTARLPVYNALGQTVRTLLDGRSPAGHRSIVWNTDDQQGRPVASGLYFIRLSADRQQSFARLIIAK